MKTAISLNRLAELVLSMDDRNMMLIPIEQGSANPIKPKKNGSNIVEYIPRFYVEKALSSLLFI